MKTDEQKITKQWVTIADASRFLGVSQDTLRRWEKKGTLIPRRTVGGHRRYSRTQLERILRQPSSQVLDIKTTIPNVTYQKQAILPPSKPAQPETPTPKVVTYHSEDKGMLQNIAFILKGNILSIIIVTLIVSLLIASYILLQITRSQISAPLSPVPSFKTLELR